MATCRVATVAIVLLLALCANTISAIKHRARSRHHAKSRRQKRLAALIAGDCKCLNWKEVFTEKRAKCGQGYEHFLPRNFTGDKGSRKKWTIFQELWEGDLCNRVYAKLDTDSCLQQNMGEGSGSAGWCYVNSKCTTDLLDVQAVSAEAGNGSTSMRMCVPGFDKFLYDSGPPELELLAANLSVDMAHFVQMVYPKMRENWERVSMAFTMNQTLLAADSFKKVQRVAANSNLTVVWGSKGGLPPFGVTQGMRVWEVAFNPRARRAVTNNPTSLDVWVNVTKFNCVRGCSAKESTERLGDARVLQQLNAGKEKLSWRPLGALHLGSPWERGRGVVQMHRQRKLKKSSKQA